MDRITVRGARQHNLKGVDLSLPREQLVVFTGPSGSGKSSLAFDTIYAEGQRRYVESLSAYARQYLEQLAKPDVDAIEGLSPAIAIEQRALTRSPRSTVGTVTEIADYLRLLFARVGRPHCPACGAKIEAQTVPQIVDRILALGEGTRVTLLAPVARGRKGELKLELERLRREGFVRARIDGALVELGDELVLDRSRPHDCDVVIDRFVVKDGIAGRLADSVELALKQGDGRLLALPGADPSAEGIWMSERFACIACGISLPPIEPRMFSFNGPHGACPTCSGIGTTTRIDPERVVPDPDKTLREGAVAAWGRRGSLSLATEVERAVRVLGVDPDARFSKLSPELREALLHGTSDETGRAEGEATKKKRRPPYEGIVPRLEARLAAGDELTSPSDDDDDGAQAEALELSRFAVTRVCDACGGKRLRREALAVKLDGRSIADVGHLPLRRVRELLTRLVELPEGEGGLSARERRVAEPLLKAVVARLGFLIDVGLDYLTLERSAQTLSGGEGQRIRLATQIGSALSGVLYVLDEPSVGLHARDNQRLLEALRRLVSLGNSVLLVEHDRETIMAADWVVDMGPGAGEHGGRVVAEGTPADLVRSPTSVTGPWLSGDKRLDAPSRKARDRRAIRVEGARTHNLRDVTVELPLGLVVGVTGVSGSGKSSLVVDTLLPAARRALYRSGELAPACDAVTGLDQIDKVISIDQAPIGRTPRSNPSTYTGLFALLRELYAGLPDARARGYKPGRFSFNVKGGRCEACQGDGVLRVEMVFLPDVFVTCEECAGRRYGRETLEIKYRGLDIAAALDLTVSEAYELFEALPAVRQKLSALLRVGLGYLRLGQSASTLSGGEAQRVKLARELARKATGRTLYVLDEPTTGLHFGDVEVLLSGIFALRDAGNTVVLIEHNLDVIASCDWVIDLGPDGGERGGLVLAEGTPEDVAAEESSHTGRFLRELLSHAASKPGKAAKGKPASKKRRA